MAKGLAFDEVTGNGQFMFNGVMAERKKWAKAAANDGKGIRIELLGGDKYRVEVSNFAIAPGEIKYLDSSPQFNPSTLAI